MTDMIFAAEHGATEGDGYFEPHGIDASATSALRIRKQLRQAQDAGLVLQQRVVSSWTEIGAGRTDERSIAATAVDGGISLMETFSTGVIGAALVRSAVSLAEAQYALCSSYLELMRRLYWSETTDGPGAA